MSEAPRSRLLSSGKAAKMELVSSTSPANVVDVQAAKTYANSLLPRDGKGAKLTDVPIGSHFMKRNPEAIKALGKKDRDSVPATSELLEILKAEEQRSGTTFTKKFGAGVSLYLKMLSLFAWTFTAMGLLSIPSLTAFIMGHGEGEVADLSMTTLANLPEVDSLGNHVEMAPWGSLDQRQIFVLLSYFDAAQIALCMASFLFLIYKQHQFEVDTDILQTTPGDYTIFVSGLPDDVEPEEISNYFEKVLSHEDSNVFTPEEVEEGCHSVADVTLHKAYASVLDRSLEIAELEKKLHILVTEHKVPPAKKVKNTRAQLQKLNEAQDKDLDAEKRPVCAFITFENDEGKDNVMKLWRQLKINSKRKAAKACCRIECCCPTPEELHPPPTLETPDYLFRDTIKLKIQRAKEPEDINFANLEKSKFETFMGKFWSFLLCWIVLIVCLALIFGIKTHSKQLKPTAVCDNEVDYTYEMSVESSHNHECYCMTKGMEDFDHCSEVFYSMIYSYSASFFTAIINVILATVIKKSAKWQLWTSYSSERAVVLVATFVAQFTNTCVILVAVELDWTKIIGFNFWTYLPGFSGAINSHDSTDYVDAAEHSHFGVEWYQVVGSSILLNLIINSVMPHMILSVTKAMTNYKNWWASWSWSCFTCCGGVGCCGGQPRAPTQSALNRMYAKKASFNLEQKYSFVLTTVFIVNSFSSTMPIMPWLGAFTFTILYRIDKHNIIHYYTDVSRKRYETEISHVAALMFPSSCLIHCLCAIVLTSDPFLVPNTVHEKTTFMGFELFHRALLPNTIHMTGLGAVFVVIIMFLNFQKFATFVKDLFKDPTQSTAEEEEEDNPTWTQTLEDNKFNTEQVFSYEVVKHPEYRHCFELTIDGAEVGSSGDIEEGRESIDISRRSRTASKLSHRSTSFSETQRESITEEGIELKEKVDELEEVKEEVKVVEAEKVENVVKEAQVQSVQSCSVGDSVTSIWGQGTVEHIREDGTVCFTLENWELAYGSKVKMFLNQKSVRVLE